MPKTSVFFIYYGQTPQNDFPTIYFAGPSRFQNPGDDWHLKASALFIRYNQSVNLLLPRPHDDNWRAGNPAAEQAQQDWQDKWLETATIRLFYFPWTSWMATAELWWTSHGLAVIGLPPTNSKPDPIRAVAKWANLPLQPNLASTVATTVDILNGL